ncbi:MAG TPA: restriction endonuclease subunit S [Synergistaceae bacterium]|nr:restriction endonuclease subunit S [Synergistaceae bacterium]HQH78987.1 restriction endonuclease subunit S [Synergistaceae bacterium]
MKWPKTTLGSIVSFKGGGTPSKDKSEYWTDEIPWATVKDFKGLTISCTQDSISKKGLKESASNIIPAGHVIIPTRMALGKAAINTIDMAINQDLRALIPKKQIDTRYLLYSMLGLAKQIEQFGTGATVKGITQNKLAELEIPLPPLDEQRRIAEILDAADALRAKRREALAQLDALLQSTFLDMFGDPVTNPKGWEVVTGAEAFEELAYGTSTKATSEPSPGNLPILRIPNVINGSIDWSDLKFINLPPKVSNKFLLNKNDLLFVRTNGNPDYIGRCARFDGHKKALFSSYLIRGRLYATSGLDSEFLKNHIEFKTYRHEVRKEARTTAGNYNLSTFGIRKFCFIKPPLSLQRRFAAIVEGVERQKARMRAHGAELDALFASLQSRAFDGEL